MEKLKMYDYINTHTHRRLSDNFNKPWVSNLIGMYYNFKAMVNC